MIDSIPIRQLLERLWLLVDTDSYTDDKFWVDNGYPEMIRIGFSNLGRGIIYQCLPNENPEEIIRKLQVICKNIISDVNEEVSQCKDAKRDLSEILHYLSNELDKILYTHQLRFEDIDNLRCTYINF